MEKSTFTYALLDCAAHDHAFNELCSQFPDIRWTSLFTGTPEQHLLSAAPILMDAEASNPELLSWLGKLERTAPSVSWIESEFGLDTLGEMLTRRLECEIDDGTVVVMRFYDPRILLGLPSALTAQQKRYFFAPVTRWTAWEWRRQAHYAITAEQPTPADLALHAIAPISLTLAQRDQLMYYDKENLYDSIIRHWHDTCPDDIAGLSPAILREIAISAVTRCSGYGIVDASSQHLFAGLMMTVSPSFDDHAMVKAYLSDAKVPQERRLSGMIDALPSDVWQQIVARKRMDALFEPAREHQGELA